MEIKIKHVSSLKTRELYKLQKQNKTKKNTKLENIKFDSLIGHRVVQAMTKSRSSQFSNHQKHHTTLITRARHKDDDDRHHDHSHFIFKTTPLLDNDAVFCEKNRGRGKCPVLITAVEYNKHFSFHHDEGTQNNQMEMVVNWSMYVLE